MSPAFSGAQDRSSAGLPTAKGNEYRSHDVSNALSQTSSSPEAVDSPAVDQPTSDPHKLSSVPGSPPLSSDNHSVRVSKAGTLPHNLRQPQEQQQQQHRDRYSQSRRTSHQSIPQDDSRPPLSERDSIFATHYTNPSPAPITSPPHSAELRASDGRSTKSTHRTSKVPHQQQGTMAVSSASPMMSQIQSLDFAALRQKDLPEYAQPRSGLHTPRPRANRSGPRSQHHRRSLYDIHDLKSIPSLSNNIAQPDPLFAKEEDSAPSTPISLPKSIDDVQDLARSTERQLYRSWRQGQAKMNGLSIAESQRQPAQVGMDKIIDAQLPLEPVAINVRSRKASHAIGLFRENDAAQRRQIERKRTEPGKDQRPELVIHQSQLTKELAAHALENAKSHSESSEQAVTEAGNNVTVSKECMAQNLSLDLLEEEISNHQELKPSNSRKTSYLTEQTASQEDKQSEAHDVQRPAKSDDDDSDREHILSATYFPHTGVILGESPTSEDTLGRKPRSADFDHSHHATQAEDVQVALQSEGSRNYLHGDFSRAASEDNKTTAKTTNEQTVVAYESEYESEYGYESLASEDEDNATDTTPTATPVIHAQTKRASSQPPPAPIGAVELKPYKHQVGGHTALYRFSRRAVCKQLNSKENMFYETVERHHRDLLGFMPRYIGVLNVTYRKDQKRRKQNELTDEANAVEERDEKDPTVATGTSAAVKPASQTDHPRMISQSMQTPTSAPQVIFENNRHLIPDDLFPMPPRSMTPDPYRARQSPPRRDNYSDDETSSGHPERPSLKPTSSWGFTSVNRKLRDHVLREVFAPPVIHRHDRRERAYHARTLRPAPTAMPHPMVRRDTSASLNGCLDLEEPPRLELDARRQAFQNRRERRRLDDADRSATDLESLLQERLTLEAQNGLSRSAEASEVDPAVNASDRYLRRRHSGGGLRREVHDIDGTRGNLEFHEDEAYTADAEDDVFAMEDVKRNGSESKHDSKMLTPDAVQLADVTTVSNTGAKAASDATTSDARPDDSFDNFMPRNPEISLTQQDERVEHFLLLEDLTAGMQRPCVLDLKMGTRQYGVEADEKKQASQRTKCRTTTSHKLGVRVCGMQVYNVKSQSYTFEDKYFGRDLKAGQEFKDALKRFFFDGIGHAQALKHIASVLEKINTLYRIIQKLPGYRLYASSLLLIYDRGDADETGKLRAEHNGEHSRPLPYPDIKLKIVDFANCVTAEDAEVVRTKKCPPRHMDAVDSGYLRGLRSLHLYFRGIRQELVAEKRHVERGEGEGMAMNPRSLFSDDGEMEVLDGSHLDPGEISL